MNGTTDTAAATFPPGHHNLEEDAILAWREMTADWEVLASTNA